MREREKFDVLDVGTQMEVLYKKWSGTDRDVRVGGAKNTLIMTRFNAQLPNKLICKAT